MLTFLLFVALVTWIGYLIGAIVAMVRRKPSGRRWLFALAGFIAFMVIGAFDPGVKQSPSSGNPKIARQVDAEQQAPARTPRPLSRQEQKREFLATVDESVSGDRIAGNPYKFVGKRVDLHCTVSNIPQEDFFNAACGTDDNGMPVIIAVETNTKDLEQGQAIRIIGTVAEPMEGNNAMGGEGHFPTVQANFME